MPHTLAALDAGALSEWRATLIVRETAYLTLEDRQKIDVEICSDPSRLNGLGDARLVADVKRMAYQLDAEAVVRRARKAEQERRVSIRPAPDTMTYLTALLPVKQGVAVYAALMRAADTSIDPDRGRGQIMADTLVERVTGVSSAQAVPVGVNVVISDAVSTGAKMMVRCLYRRSGSNALVALESRSRVFPKGLSELIDFRDQTCRTPWCDAPIRHHDHAVPHSEGGPTEARNGLGLCEHCNYVKDAAGWHIGAIDDMDRHTVEYVTPTGETYRSTAPPLV